MKKVIKNKLILFSNLLLKYFNFKQKFIIGNNIIMLTSDHKLPDYKKKFTYYDNFLPFLSKYLTKNSIVVDVGANVGDTLYSIVNKNNNLQFICIEADQKFYNYLVMNVKNLTINNPNIKITTVKKFIGNKINNVYLSGKNGSKKALPGGKIKSKRLDTVLHQLKIDPHKISLIKSDVDGFDYDIIKSSYQFIKHKPLLFFECQLDNKMQYFEFLDLFKELISKKYKHFIFFDNYGQYICKCSDITSINDLLNYTLFQNYEKSKRTIYYYDVLAYDNKKSFLISKIINEYKKIH